MFGIAVSSMDERCLFEIAFSTMDIWCVFGIAFSTMGEWCMFGIAVSSMGGWKVCVWDCSQYHRWMVHVLSVQRVNGACLWLQSVQRVNGACLLGEWCMFMIAVSTMGEHAIAHSHICLYNWVGYNLQILHMSAETKDTSVQRCCFFSSLIQQLLLCHYFKELDVLLCTNLIIIW